MCMTAAGRRLSGLFCQNFFSLKMVSSQLVAFKDLDIFHLTLPSLSLQINIFFYDLEVQFLPFCCQTFKVFEFKAAELEAHLENTEADQPVITNKLVF